MATGSDDSRPAIGAANSLKFLEWRRFVACAGRPNSRPLALFSLQNKLSALENLDHSSTPGQEGGQFEMHSAGDGRRSASNVVQICQRHVVKAIIPFIPLTADLENGHEESVN